MIDENIILKYIKGELTFSEKKDFLDWVDSSDANKEQYRQLRKLWDLSLLTGKYADKNHNKAYRQIQSQIKKAHNFKGIQQNKPYRFFLKLIETAAIVIITLGISWYFFNRPDWEPPVAYHNIEVPTGQRVKLTLSDGSTVWLNAGTKFTYPDRFSVTERHVVLNGEAQFNIAHNEKHPFVVQTSTYSAKVLGTKFNVYAYDEASNFEATLFNGSVSLYNKNSTQKEILLQPGQQAVFDKKSIEMSIFYRTDTADIASWVDGYHVFNKTSFQDMVERLSHYYEKKITVQYPAILGYECTGKFRHDESLEHILNVVKISKPFKYKIIENEVIIY